MKATKKMFGAVALSAALALGTAVPAFADTVADADKGNVPNYDPAPEVSATDAGNELSAVGGKVINGDVTEADESTAVEISTYTSQISAQIPIKLPVKLDTAGGEGLAPANYYIMNTCVSDLQVTGAKYAIKGTYNDSTDTATGERLNWSMPRTTVDFSNAASLAGTDNAGKYTVNGTSGVTPAIGTLMLKLAPHDGDSVKADTTKALGEIKTQAATAANPFEGATTTLNWKLPNTTGAASGEDGVKVVLDVNAYSSPLKKEIKGTAATEVMGITYTISLAPQA